MPPREKGEDDSQKVPGWIVSYGDMVTLLLAFFVLLQVFASTIDPELFNAGQGSFRRAVQGMGLPDWLIGQPHTPLDAEPAQPQPTEQTSEEKQRVLDAEEERLRQMFAAMKEAMETDARNLSKRHRQVMPTSIRFGDLGTALNEEARTYLDEFAVGFQQGAASQKATIYVVGFAPDAPGGRTQWLTASHRANAVAAYLRRKLSSDNGTTEITAWGAPGGWYADEPTGEIAEKTFVRMAVEME